MARRKKQTQEDESLSTNCITRKRLTERQIAQRNLRKVKEHESKGNYKYIEHTDTFRALKRVRIN